MKTKVELNEKEKRFNTPFIPVSNIYIRINNMIEPNAKSPKVIAGKLKDCGWNILYLHEPNEFDKLSTNLYYYYDCSGNEIPITMIEKYVILEN